MQLLFHLFLDPNLFRPSWKYGCIDKASKNNFLHNCMIETIKNDSRKPQTPRTFQHLDTECPSEPMQPPSTIQSPTRGKVQDVAF